MRKLIPILSVVVPLISGCGSSADAPSDGMGDADQTAAEGSVPDYASTATNPPVTPTTYPTAGATAAVPTTEPTTVDPMETSTTVDPVDPVDPTETSPTPSTTGTSVTSPPPPTQDGTVFPARCNGDASQTIMIGDSYLALSGEVTSFLEGYAGQMYRHYYVSGTQMSGGLPPSIPDQYRLSVAQGPVQTVIMDGGGNDVLLGDMSCRLTGPAPGSACEATVLGIVDAVETLMGELAQAGVEEVVYFFYPHLPANDGLNPTLDYGVPLVQGACEGAQGIDCKFVDIRPSFEGHPEYIGLDGIHPTTPGSETIAGLVWDTMQNNCDYGLSLN